MIIIKSTKRIGSWSLRFTLQAKDYSKGVSKKDRNHQRPFNSIETEQRENWNDFNQGQGNINRGTKKIKEQIQIGYKEKWRKKNCSSDEEEAINSDREWAYREVRNKVGEGINRSARDSKGIQKRKQDY